MLRASLNYTVRSILRELAQSAPEIDDPPKIFRFHTTSHSKSEDFPFCDQMPLGVLFLSVTVRGNAFIAQQNRLSATARVFRTFAAQNPRTVRLIDSTPEKARRRPGAVGLKETTLSQPLDIS